MKYIGIDFGTKRVGVALSDERGELAFPRVVIENNRSLGTKIKELCERELVEKMIVGESLGYDQKPNAVMKDIEAFVRDMTEMLGIPIELEPEFMTSAQAEQVRGKHAMIDASAAAIILQSYLDKQKNGKHNI